MVKKQNIDITCPYKSTNINPSPQQLQSLGKPPTRKIVKHGLSCDGPNASWDDETRTLKVCYQLAFDFVQLYLAYIPTAPPQAAVNQKPKRKPK